MATADSTTRKRLKFFRERVPLYQNDPTLFAVEILQFVPDTWQEEALKSLAASPKVSVRSGHGVGKTACEAVALLWFLCCFQYPKVVATAPTRQQLNDVLWSEVAKWMSRSPLLSILLRWTKTYVYMSGKEKRWFAVAKTASKPENMQGFHEDNLLFIVDEASGVEDEIMETVLGSLSGANNKIIMCGNPTKASGVFYDSHTRDRALYKCLSVSSLDSHRTNKDNIASFIRKYGENSNVVRVRVYGEFPTQEDDVFIPLSLVEKAVNNEISSEKITSISFGVDVARYGDDETVIAKNINGAITLPVCRRGQDTMKTVGDIVIEYRRAIIEYPSYLGKIKIMIDDTGVGGGVTDRLREVVREEHLSRLMVVPVNFGGKVPYEDAAAYYSNNATYMWATIRDMMEEKAISIVDDDELVAQFSVRKYSITSSGKTELERKEDMKKRGIGSPDRADAVALSCYKIKLFDIKSLVS